MKDSTRQRRRNAGFTLLETIVALSVILAAAIGPVSLVTSGLVDFSFAKNKLVAANLSQEGIELIRGLREDNIICDMLNGAPVWPWNEDPALPNPGNTFMSSSFGVSVDNSTTIDCGIGGISMTVPILSASCSEKLRFDPATGIYGYTGAEETIFTRCVQVKTPPDSPDSGILPADQMDIISTVTWSDRNSPRTLEIKERLYNWR